METICKPRVFFDVDETLVKIKANGDLEPHEEHIEQLKKHYMRGHHITVWSAGGWDWARRVIMRLELVNYVDEVSDKPRWIYDDIEANQWCDRIYHYKEGWNAGRSIGAYTEVDRINETVIDLGDSPTGNSNQLHIVLKEQGSRSTGTELDIERESGAV